MGKLSISLLVFLFITAQAHADELRETETFVASNGFKLDLVTDLMTDKVSLRVQDYLWATDDGRTKGAMRANNVSKVTCFTVLPQMPSFCS